LASSQELLDGLELFGIRLGLERIRELLVRLGDPQLAVPVVLVAGTNGKGSTAALLAAIATAAGYHTGLYTSPHLQSVRERIRVDGVSISEPGLSAALERVLGAGTATYFEALTAAALVEFERREVELAVLEVGLGGRLDATNVADPVLSLITEIALDHQEHLGATLAEIAREKAGILRPRVPALAWVSAPPARQALERVAAELPSGLRFVDRECGLGRGRDGAVELRTARRSYRLRPRLVGSHQYGNLALAVCGAETLAGIGFERIARREIEEGVAGCFWPGRLEWVESGSEVRVLLDGAHNANSAGALREYLDEQVPDYTLLFGVLRDKEVGRMLPELAATAAHTVLTTPASPRAVPPGELLPLVRRGAAVVVPDPRAALEVALATGRPVVVCGSLYLVGAIRSELRRAYGTPPPAEDEPTYSRVRSVP
jgi:dihydrofolate synthase/folylpolyglutamate synthase